MDNSFKNRQQTKGKQNKTKQNKKKQKNKTKQNKNKNKNKNKKNRKQICGRIKFGIIPYHTCTIDGLG